MLLILFVRISINVNCSFLSLLITLFFTLFITLFITLFVTCLSFCLALCQIFVTLFPAVKGAALLAVSLVLMCHYVSHLMFHQGLLRIVHGNFVIATVAVVFHYYYYRCCCLTYPCATFGCLWFLLFVIHICYLTVSVGNCMFCVEFVSKDKC